MKTKILQKTFVALIVVAASLILMLSTRQSQSQGVLGTYELSFCPGSILYVNQAELLLHAYVADSSGSPALSGSVIFQVCTRGGDFHQDPQPSSACDIDNTANWQTLQAPVKVNVAGTPFCGSVCLPVGPGNACGFWGVVSNPRTIGFRFKYLGQGSGIANRTSEAKDVTWLPLP